jgi:hypothetical protein
MTPETGSIVPHDVLFTDLVLQLEPGRRWAVSEFRAGRFPLWQTYGFCGSPAILPLYSPLWLPQAFISSPLIIAWGTLAVALVAGGGMYLFCRRCLRVGFWPAAIVAWCYPLTAFFIFWQGQYCFATTVAWLPWVLLGVHRAVRRPSGVRVAVLAVPTALAAVSGHPDIAAEVLMVAGLYALWCLGDCHWKRWLTGRCARATLAVALGFGAGLLLAAPELLRYAEYMPSGRHMVERYNHGGEQHSPTDLSALPQVVLPDMYGESWRYNSLYIGKGNQFESAAQGYAGLVAVLLVAPLAWCSRIHRSRAIFFTLLAFIGLAWTIDVPGIVWLLKHPPINMLPFGRLIFSTGFATLALSAIGLEQIWQGTVQRRWWFWVAFASLARLFEWCIYRAFVPPEPLATQLAAIVGQGQAVRWIRSLADVEILKASFARSYGVAAILCILGLAGWLALWFRRNPRPWFGPVVAACMLAELLWFGYDRNSQCDPRLYYPSIPALEHLAHAQIPGRMMGYNCLPAVIGAGVGLRDVRGYDSVDPTQMI